MTSKHILRFVPLVDTRPWKQENTSKEEGTLMSLFYWLLLLLVFFFLIHTLRQLKRRHSTPPPWYRDIYSFFPWRVIFKSPPRLAPLTFRSYRFSIPLIGDSIGFLVNPYNFIRSRFEKYGKYSRATLFGRYHLLRNHSLTPITPTA